MTRLKSLAGITVATLIALTNCCAAEQSALDLVRQFNDVFAEVAQKVSSAVVIVNVVQKLPEGAFGDDEDEAGPFDSLPPALKKFHEQFKRQPYSEVSAGSGVIVREDGYILTNYHVVEDADKIDVKLQDGHTLRASVRGTDPQSDLAVIKIDAKGLVAAKFADSAKTRVGEFAIAVGAPFRLDYSVTFGHVSAKGRSNVLQGYEAVAMDQDFIQTDALINPGNSGGPLVNIDGEVIGINTLIHGLHSGIGFAIPSNLAKEVSDQLIAQGKFTRAWLGVVIGALRDNLELRQKIQVLEEGVVVSEMVPHGPAARSELKPGDIITSIDGQRVSTPQELRTEVRRKTIGQPITLDVFRKGQTNQIKISPEEWVQPSPVLAKAKNDPPRLQTTPANLGITVQELTTDLAARFGVTASEGVVISAVEKNSLAARKGLKPGDVITSIDQEPVINPKQFHSAIKKADLKKGVLVNLISGDTPRFEILKAQP
ncbi:MAG TPA: trypsin-like peptidase domain-containing protein [Candidatus Limnocylindrales bacterium]|nr:trypsin-like peptidase domain-containing protein [Candidatus Limnocylindrales bacterium]